MTIKNKNIENLIPTDDIINLDGSSISNFNCTFTYIKFNPREKLDFSNSINRTLQINLKWNTINGSSIDDDLQNNTLNQGQNRNIFIDEIIKISKTIFKQSRFIFIDELLGLDQNNNITGSINFISNTISNQNNVFQQAVVNLTNSSDISNSIFVNNSTFIKKSSSVINNVAGYLILKEESNSKNFSNPVLIDRILITNSNIGEYNDFILRYGKYYRYTIYPIIKLFIDTNETGEIDFLRIYVLGNKSLEKIISTIENNNPEEPNDFLQFYNQVDNSIALTWSITKNKTQDIKYFEILRRESLDEPYELLKLQDFNDDITRSFNNILPNEFIDKQYEIIRNNNNQIEEIKSYPTMVYKDLNFNKNKKYIYCIRGIDARGLKSNYSEQIQVYFDYKTNNITRKLISRSGAPDLYPNLYIKNIDNLPRTFNILSKHKNFDLFFDPDNFSIINNSSRIDLINYFDNSIDSRGNGLEKEIFKLNFTNIDSKKQNSIKIFINKKLET